MSHRTRPEKNYSVMLSGKISNNTNNKTRLSNFSETITTSFGPWVIIAIAPLSPSASKSNSSICCLRP